MLSFNIEPKWKNVEEDAVFSVRMSCDSSVVATTLSNGQIVLRSVATGRLSYTLTHSESGSPVSSVRFHPKMPKVFLTVSSDGSIKEWSSPIPTVSWEYSDDQNELYALDYNFNGELFATGGTDSSVRLYDNKTKQIIHSFARKKFDMTSPVGHSDRVYAIKFHPTQNNIMISGGWDNTLQVWDVRDNNFITSIYGPHISGDSLDTRDNLILAGSWRTHDQIQLWDLRNFENIKTMRWSLAGDDNQCYVYVARFIPSGKYFIAGGSGVNQLRAFSLETFTTSGSVLYFESSVFGASVLPNSSGIIVGTSNGGVFFHEMHAADDVFKYTDIAKNQMTLV